MPHGVGATRWPAAALPSPPPAGLLALHGARPLEGGVPIIIDGKIIGAIGVSGGTSSQDGQVARAGADAAAAK